MGVRRVLPRDAIPSIDDPEFGSEYAGEPDDEVAVIDADPPRAYPLRILNFHEIVNDRVDGTPVAVTWCPLCGSAVAYDRRVEGRILTFGVSGKLADDDLVMYDRETESEWKQSHGECIAGDLEGERLRALPAALTTWARFTANRPEGVVLQPVDAESEAASDTDEPAPVDYDRDPYREYVEGEGFGLAAHRGEEGRSWDRDDLDPKTVVLGIERDGEALGVPLPTVEAEGGVVTAIVGETAVVVFAIDGELHAYEHPGIEFEPADDEYFEGDGTTWDPTTGRAADGRELVRVPARRLFAFAWQDDHGTESFYRGD